MLKKYGLMFIVLLFMSLISCTHEVSDTPDTSESTSITKEMPKTEYQTVEIGRITGGEKQYTGMIALSFIENIYQVWWALDKDIYITSEFGTDFLSFPDFPEADYAILEVAEVDNQYRIYENGFYRSFRINDYSEFGGAKSTLTGETVSWSGSTVIGVKFTGNDLKRAEGKLAFLLRVYDCDGNEITSYYHGISVSYVKNGANIIICTDDKFEEAKRLMGN